MESLTKKTRVIDVATHARYRENFDETLLRIDFTLKDEVRESLDLRNYLALKIQDFFNGTTK
jgi:hypothetical protein